MDDKNACTVDGCDQFSGPYHTPIFIDDKNACTADSCNPSNGVVTHAFVPVEDGNLCTFDDCDPFTGTVTHTPVFSDDNACTVESCDPSTGVTLQMPVDCSDNNPCTTDSCDPVSGCQHTGGVIFSEDFSGNMQSWQLGPGWQIGSAKVSFGQTTGNPDPDFDHSPSLDNGVAGVVIGGNVSTSLQGPNYLTSPVMNLNGFSGATTLEYWRWLNSDYLPYMDSTTQVFDGIKWVTLYSVSPSTFVMDNAWTRYQFDVTPYKNANFQVRWGWLVGSAGVLTMSGWNIDDVRITGASNTCL